MSRDSSRKPSGSSNHSRTHSPTNSPSNQLPPKRITPNTTGNMLSVGVSGATNLTGYNSGWQVWGSASPSKRNIAQSSVVNVNELAPTPPDINRRASLHEGWTPSRPASASWGDVPSSPLPQDISSQMETPLPLNIHASRQRQTQPAPFSGPRLDTRPKTVYEHSVGSEPSPVRYNTTSTSPTFVTGFSSQQSGFSTSTAYDPVSGPSVVDDLSLSIRGMAVEDDFQVTVNPASLALQPHPQLPGVLPPTQGPPPRIPPSIVQPRLPYGAYPNFYAPAPRDPYSEYPYGYHISDPSLYGSTLANAPPSGPYSGPNIGAPSMSVNVDLHRQQQQQQQLQMQQQNIFYDYPARQQSQFYYPTPPPIIFPPGAPPPMMNPVALSIAEKKREASYNMQQQLIAQNPMFNPLRATPPPNMSGYPPNLDYGGQMPMMMPTPYGSNIQGLHPYPPGMRILSHRSPLLEEFRNNKARQWELQDIFGHVVEFSGDQHGSRFIQQKLETASSEDKQVVFDEIVPANTLQLIQDVFGNYVIQKIFEHGTQLQKTRLAGAMEGHIYPLATQMYGCRVVQKAIECILPEQQTAFVRELEPHIQNCVRHAHGNHVVQKMIERIPPERLGFIHTFKGCVMELATNSYGCRVLQRCLEHLPYEYTQPLLDELHRRTIQLMTDQYGNYVIQFILEHGRPEDRTLMVSKLRGQLLELGRHKFASNVCEKALLSADPETRHALIDEILAVGKQDPITAMMKDQFGNYVLQRTVVVADKDQRDLLITRIRAQIPQLRRTSSAYNKHLLSIERLIEKYNNH